MELLSVAGVFLASGFICMVVSVVAAEKEEGGKSFIFFLFASLFFSFASFEAFDQGKSGERTLNTAHNYLVKVKKQSNLDMPLVVYDMVDKKDRVIDLEVYPPSEFSEVFTADGKIMLVPK